MSGQSGTERPWMIYGANGYTGRLIAKAAGRLGMRPILAGRNAEAINTLAGELGVESRVFPIDEGTGLAEQFDGVDLVLLAAGPFSATSRPVVDACMSVGAHYLDITGEIDVFEACHARHDEARERGVIVMPGVGFDVVPTDCLAARLKEALPEATHLELAFHMSSGPSSGTAKTAIEKIGHGGAVRRQGRIQRVPAAWRTKTIPFRDRPRHAVSIPWGDVATAWYSTGIPNIVVYMSMPKRQVRLMELTRSVTPLLGTRPVQGLLKWLIDRMVEGPDERQRATGRAQIWGRVTDAADRSQEATLVTPEGYALTVRTAITAVKRVLEGGVQTGALTPSMAFGSGFITEIEGCDLEMGAPGA